MQTPEEDDVQETVPSTSVTEDSEEAVLSSASSAYDCVTTGSDQTTSTTMSIVPDLMEFDESACDPRSTTPTKNPNGKERGNSDDECKFLRQF